MIRVFLALPLAPLFEKEIAPLVLELKQGTSRIRWVAASEVHLTLHFFGSAPEEDVETISKVVRPICSQVSPLEIFLEKVGAFPSMEKPRVFWVGVNGDVDRIRSLHSEIETSLARAGFPGESRPFKTHVTIGRAKEGAQFPVRNDFSFGPTAKKTLHHAVLFQSYLRPEGAHYEALATYPFRAS